jgi:hypothetical protein
MTDSQALGAAEPAHADDHGAGDGHDDDHGSGHEHGEEALGPIDVAAWGAGILGLAIGAVMAVAFALSTGLLTV